MRHKKAKKTTQNNLNTKQKLHVILQAPWDRHFSAGEDSVLDLLACKHGRCILWMESASIWQKKISYFFLALNPPQPHPLFWKATHSRPPPHVGANPPTYPPTYPILFPPVMDLGHVLLVSSPMHFAWCAVLLIVFVGLLAYLNICPPGCFSQIRGLGHRFSLPKMMALQVSTTFDLKSKSSKRNAKKDSLPKH